MYDLSAIGERFWPLVDKRPGQGVGDCHEWQGARTNRGYGTFCLDARREHTYRTTSHRVAWLLTTGDLPAKRQVVMHTCDNPPCCNPAHLRLGTQSENQLDMWLKRRDRHRKISRDQRGAIRDRYAAGGVTQRELAQEYGVTPGLISMIVTRYGSLRHY